MQEDHICVHMNINGSFIPAGILTYVDNGDRPYSEFQYGTRYLQNPSAIPVDPVQLPLRLGVFRTEKGAGLFNGIRDACPGEWGKRLLSLAASSVGAAMKEPAYILFAGPERSGALGFSSHVTTKAFSDTPPWDSSEMNAELTLDDLALAAAMTSAGEVLPTRFHSFFSHASSMNGSRPSATVRQKGIQMLAKFQKPSDSWAVCRIEDACMRLARLCGIDVPKFERVTVLEGTCDVFLIERFDRMYFSGLTFRIPYASMTTMCETANNDRIDRYSVLADIPNLPIYDLRYRQADKRAIFTRMVFNALCGNSEDFPRNHGFIYSIHGWRLAPAFDLTPTKSFIDNNCLSLDIGKFGKSVSRENLLSRYGNFDITLEEAKIIYNNMIRKIASEWEAIFISSGVPREQIQELKGCFFLAIEYAKTHK